jgi:hypothetical protein
MKFANFLWYICKSVVPISWAKVDSKVKVVEKIISFPKFHKQGKVSNTNQDLSWKLVS